jgi:hypothetical protein
MTGILIYFTVGIVMACLARVDGDRMAITAGPVYIFLFLGLWPIVLVYIVYMTFTRGVIKYKGKVIWRANKQ